MKEISYSNYKGGIGMFNKGRKIRDLDHKYLELLNEILNLKKDNENINLLIDIHLNKLLFQPL